jgi:light-regulated signal transduction histidine kinase (bacteriophytochrome)
MIITDITTQKIAQQQLEDSNRQLEKINHALELNNHDLQQFASVASHDLQEPLRKIQMFSALLKTHNETYLTDDSKKHLDKIIDAARRMKTLIIDILSYSKLSATDNTFEHINLNRILDEFQEDFELTIQDKRATVKVGKLAVIAANKGQMRQVFQNILSNALTSFLMREVLIKVEGSAKVGKSGVYKNIPIFYEGKQPLNFLD